MPFDRFTCFLAYSDSYRTTMERIRRLLEVLDFQVTVFDGPDQRSISDVVRSDIAKADCVVVLLGPDLRKTPPSVEPASWPDHELTVASTLEKPIALLLHPGTPVPEILGNFQAPARFLFEDDSSYAENVHHVVKHLLDTKRRLTIPPGAGPYYFSRSAFLFRLDRELEYIDHDVYHDIVAREPWSKLSHSVDTGKDLSASAKITIRNKNRVVVNDSSGGTGHDFNLTWEEASQHAQRYIIEIRPELPAGGRLGYRRTFRLNNYFPLTRAELNARAAEEGFPKLFTVGNSLLYGPSADVNSEMESLRIVLEFPSHVPLDETRPAHGLAIVARTGAVNATETKRINMADILSVATDELRGITTMQLDISRPIPAHSYLLLYDLAG